ncbi:MAG: carboxymuconolactone decarboxylase family protein [Nitrospirae bacterium]|nr:MAG: carboxymuconolactone decarboxylase family protein [Nitrospirota bacterium]
MKHHTSRVEVDEVLESVGRQLGFVPNVLKEMSINPTVLHVYLKGQETLVRGQLTPKEQQAVQLMVSVFNDCQYCQAAHRWLGMQVGVSPSDVQALLAGGIPTGDPALAAVARATKLLLENKGWLDPEVLSTLASEGVDRARLYEIIALIGLKTISNYINHIAHTPIDESLMHG